MLFEGCHYFAQLCVASTNRGAAFVRVNTVHVMDVSSITGPTKEMILLVSLLLSVLCMYIYVVCHCDSYRVAC